jgi:hypothetical protein
MKKGTCLGKFFLYNLLMIYIYAISLKNNGGGDQGFFFKIKIAI